MAHQLPLGIEWREYGGWIGFVHEQVFSNILGFTSPIPVMLTKCKTSPKPHDTDPRVWAGARTWNDLWKTSQTTEVCESEDWERSCSKILWVRAKLDQASEKQILCPFIYPCEKIWVYLSRSNKNKRSIGGVHKFLIQTWCLLHVRQIYGTNLLLIYLVDGVGRWSTETLKDTDPKQQSISTPSWSFSLTSSIFFYITDFLKSVVHEISLHNHQSPRHEHM